MKKWYLKLFYCLALLVCLFGLFITLGVKKVNCADSTLVNFYTDNEGEGEQFEVFMHFDSDYILSLESNNSYGVVGVSNLHGLNVWLVKIEKDSDGDVSIRCYYPNGLGDTNLLASFHVLYNQVQNNYYCFRYDLWTGKVWVGYSSSFNLTDGPQFTGVYRDNMPSAIHSHGFTVLTASTIKVIQWDYSGPIRNADIDNDFYSYVYSYYWTKSMTDTANEYYYSGYYTGYDDGQTGYTALDKVWLLLSGIFGTMGSIFAIELIPHVPLGTFILVPIFFGVFLFILRIWRNK